MPLWVRSTEGLGLARGRRDCTRATEAVLTRSGAERCCACAARPAKNKTERKAHLALAAGRARSEASEPEQLVLNFVLASMTAMLAGDQERQQRKSACTPRRKTSATPRKEKKRFAYRGQLH
jgi:hypothetical protein